MKSLAVGALLEEIEVKERHLYAPGEFHVTLCGKPTHHTGSPHRKRDWRTGDYCPSCVAEWKWRLARKA